MSFWRDHARPWLRKRLAKKIAKIRGKLQNDDNFHRLSGAQRTRLLKKLKRYEDKLAKG